MIEDIRAAIPLGLVLSFVIGPVFFVLLETSATRGFRAAISFDFGVLMGDMFFICIAYFSSYKLLENLSNEPGLYIFGGVILLVYGVVTYLKKESKKDQPHIKTKKRDYLGLFAKGFLLNFINIGVLAFWMGLIIIVGPSVDNVPERMLVFFSTVLGTYFVVDIFKILLAKQLRSRLTDRRIYLMKKVLGVILMVCGMVLIVKGFLPKNDFNFETELEKIAE